MLAFSLTEMLKGDYDVVGLVESDVLLDADWFPETMALFDRGAADGLTVGAVSPRSYVDRVLIQRDGYCVLHNCGAGVILMTREAAQLVLATFRTGWWPHIRGSWMRLAGIDIGRYAAFRGNEQWVTTDWTWDAVLASHGLASLALTPAKCTMIGQVPSLADQGLELTTGQVPMAKLSTSMVEQDDAFEIYRDRLRQIRNGSWNCESPVMEIDQCIGGTRIVFPHHAPKFGATYSGNWKLQWSQGFGPFAYRAGPGGASLSLPAYGTISFLVSGGANGAECKLKDAATGYEHSPILRRADVEQGMVQLVLPGSVIYREVQLDLTEGGVFYGYSSSEPQPSLPDVHFDYTTLPLAGD
jgi:hypothetical protein